MNNPCDLEMEAMLSSQNLIRLIPGLNSLFHDPIPNNYVWLLIPKNKDKEAYISRFALQTSCLNKADGFLFNTCKLMLNRLGFSLTHHVYQTIDYWRTGLCGQYRSNIDDIYLAERVVEEIQTKLPEGSDFPSVIRKESPEVIDKFINIPEQIKSLVRVNLYLPHEQVRNCLATLLREISSSGSSLLMLVDRIEIAKVGLTDNNQVNYPTLIIYLAPEANNMNNLHIVRSLLKLTASVATEYPPAPLLNSEYSDCWLLNTTVTQGFRLYKRYLAILGVLSSVYDAHWNFAYLIGSDWKDVLYHL